MLSLVPSLRVVPSTHSPFLIKNSNLILNNTVLRDEYGFTILVNKDELKNQITQDNIVIKVNQILSENELFIKFMEEESNKKD